MNNSKNLYLDLEELIKPMLLDDFCGYDEESQSFNIVLAVKQIIEAKEQECEELKNDKFVLELRLDELTSSVNVEDCEHRVFNGEYIACRYYEGQRCDDADFVNCMFRENIRLKQQLDQLKAELEQLKTNKG